MAQEADRIRRWEEDQHNNSVEAGVAQDTTRVFFHLLLKVRMPYDANGYCEYAKRGYLRGRIEVLKMLFPDFVKSAIELKIPKDLVLV